MRERINFKKRLPATFNAVHSTGGRTGATRWMIYDGADNYRGDLVRWLPEGTWSWQPYPLEEGEIFNGTFEECVDEIFKLAD